MAAQKIWHLGGKIPCALVWIDRQLGARENLEQYGIKLYSIVDPQILALNSNELKKAIKEDKQEKCYIDFGGNSKTSVYSALMQ
jgi:orotate phosphoribosyltransferase